MNNSIDNILFNNKYQLFNIEDDCDGDCPCKYDDINCLCGYTDDACFVEKRLIIKDVLCHKKAFDEFKILDENADDHQYEIFRCKYLIRRQLLYGNKKEMLKNVEICEEIANHLINYVLFENGSIIIEEENGAIDPSNNETEKAKLFMVDDLHQMVKFHRHLLNCVAF